MIRALLFRAIEEMMPVPVPTREDLLGIWTLVSAETQMPTGEIKHPFGRSPTGSIVYLANGSMAVHIAGSDRAEGRVWVYAGSWALEGDRVVHCVECSLTSALTGQRLERRVRIEGNRLILTTVETQGAGRPVLVWKRAATR